MPLTEIAPQTPTYDDAAVIEQAIANAHRFKDTPLDSGFGADTVTLAPTEPVVWDPEKAIDAYGEARDCELKAQGIKASLMKMAGTEMVKNTVRVSDDSGNHKRLSMPEYVDWLAAQDAKAMSDFERFGGQAAIEAYMAGAQAVSYAGETPSRPRYTPKKPANYIPTLP